MAVIQTTSERAKKESESGGKEGVEPKLELVVPALEKRV